MSSDDIYTRKTEILLIVIGEAKAANDATAPAVAANDATLVSAAVAA